jgi:hypothetical protein
VSENQNVVMITDSRGHERIQLPFEVELSHPSLGKVRSMARDISEGGVFVTLESETLQSAGLKQGARIRLTVLNAALVESNPTPTVEMELVRLADNGIGLKFTSHTARHLWQSVQRMRDELELGRDYFQVFQAALVTSPTGKLLVLQQNGRWLFPGKHLVVGQDWQSSLKAFLDTELGIPAAEFVDTVMVDSAPEVSAHQNATLSLFHRFSAGASKVNLRPDSRYRHPRWIARPLEIDELSFAHPSLRSIARQALSRIAANSG